MSARGSAKTGQPNRIAVSRPLVGVLALVCLGSATALWTAGPADHTWMLWRAGFMRVGLVMSAFWLALPSRQREAAWANVTPWTLLGMLLAIVAAARFPRTVIPILLIVAAVGFLLRPREKKRPGRRRKE